MSQSDDIQVSEAARDPYESEWVARFDGEKEVGGLEIAERSNMRAYMFSSVTMEVKP